MFNMFSSFRIRTVSQCERNQNCCGRKIHLQHKPWPGNETNTNHGQSSQLSDVCIYLSIYIYTHIYTYIHIYTHICTYIHIYTHIYTYIHIYTHIYTYIHIYTHIYTYIHIFTHIYTYIHIYTHIYTYMHIYTMKLVASPQESQTAPK